MTPEQWSHINSRLSALQAFVLALGETCPDQLALRANVEEHREILRTVALHSQTAEAEAQTDLVLHEIDRLSAALWAKEK